MSKAPAQKNDAVDLLDADHIAVKKLLTEFGKLCGVNAPAKDKKSYRESPPK